MRKIPPDSCDALAYKTQNRSVLSSVTNRLTDESRGCHLRIPLAIRASGLNLRSVGTKSGAREVAARIASRMDGLEGHPGVRLRFGADDPRMAASRC